jgi:hypothetical protein
MSGSGAIRRDQAISAHPALHISIVSIVATEHNYSA